MWKPKSAAGSAAPTSAPAASVPPPAPPPPPPVAATPAAVPPPAPPVAAAALPPVNPAAPPQPQAPAAAPRARRGRPGVTAAPAAAPAAVPPPVAPPAAAPVTTAVAAPAGSAPSIPLGGFFAVLAPPANVTVSAFSDAASIVESVGKPNVFPTLELTKDGMFTFDTMNAEGMNADLPSGKVAIVGMALGCRIKGLFWPKKQEQGVKNKPFGDFIIGQFDKPNVDLFLRAYKNYQMGDRQIRSQVFDPIGHPSGVLEVLIYEPTAGLMVVQSHQSFTSVGRSAINLDKGRPPQLALGIPYPVLIDVVGEEQKGAVPWTEQILTFRGMDTNDSPELLAEFQAANQALQDLYTANANDPSLVAALTEWITGTITPEQSARLNAIYQAAAR